MKVFELKSLVCKNKHSFDFAKQGYIHLLANGGKSKTKYDKDLFESRRNLMAENKFYEPVIQKIVQFLLIYTNNKSHLTILDTGCGDGSHVNNIHKNYTPMISIQR